MLKDSVICFDVALHGLSKTNWRSIADYPNSMAFMDYVLRILGVAETVSLDYIKQGYCSIKGLNPFGIVPSELSDAIELLANAKRARGPELRRAS